MDSLIISFACNKNVLMGISLKRLERAKNPLLPSSTLSCLTVVSLGEVEVAIGKSSNPTILMSSGTLYPSCIHFLIAAQATSSWLQITAVMPDSKNFGRYFSIHSEI